MTRTLLQTLGLNAAAGVGRAHVPCGTCHECCRSEIVTLLPEEGDKLEDYEHAMVETPTGTIAALKHKPNGDCVYLGETGCTIHGRAPFICRVFDCRRWYLAHTRHERRAMQAHSPGTRRTFRAGYERLETLK